MQRQTATIQRSNCLSMQDQVHKVRLNLVGPSASAVFLSPSKSSSSSKQPSTWPSWASTQIKYVRKATSNTVQRLLSGSQDGNAAAADAEGGGFDVDSMYTMPRSGTLSWSSVHSALPKPIKQLHQSFLRKPSSPTLPRTNHEAMRMSAAAHQHQIQVGGETIIGILD